GAFALDLVLQMNVPPNFYSIRSLVWDQLTSREVFPGPSAQVSVVPGTAFSGTVQMNPTLTVRAMPDDSRASAS
ncbi:MAG TPA: hypothetical protein VN717_06110, partial [Gemmatimonadaceae bacterium]|nr:hypothetical protein [Gemmatimonadaceae bacterium]